MDLPLIVKWFVQETEVEEEDTEAEKEELQQIMLTGKDFGKEEGEDDPPKDTDAGMDHEGDQVHSQSVLIGKDSVASQVADAELGQPKPMKDLNKEKHYRAGELARPDAPLKNSSLVSSFFIVSLVIICC